MDSAKIMVEAFDDRDKKSSSWKHTRQPSFMDMKAVQFSLAPDQIVRAASVQSKLEQADIEHDYSVEKYLAPEIDYAQTLNSGLTIHKNTHTNPKLDQKGRALNRQIIGKSDEYHHQQQKAQETYQKSKSHSYSKLGARKKSTQSMSGISSLEMTNKKFQFRQKRQQRSGSQAKLIDDETYSKICQSVTKRVIIEQTKEDEEMKARMKLLKG